MNHCRRSTSFTMTFPQEKRFANVTDHFRQAGFRNFRDFWRSELGNGEVVSPNIAGWIIFKDYAAVTFQGLVSNVAGWIILEDFAAVT